MLLKDKLDPVQDARFNATQTCMSGTRERLLDELLVSLTNVDAPQKLFWIHGPPGLGKTMVACGLGLQAVNSGYTVCFEKMTSLIKILDTAETERAAGFRLKNIKKAQLIIIDEIGYTPISRGQANRFFTFISDTYETSSIIFTTNKEIVDWAEMMGDPVLTTAMLDRILHHAKCYSFRGESYRLKHPDLYPQGETGM